MTVVIRAGNVFESVWISKQKGITEWLNIKYKHDVDLNAPDWKRE